MNTTTNTTLRGAARVSYLAAAQRGAAATAALDLASRELGLSTRSSGYFRSPEPGTIGAWGESGVTLDSADAGARAAVWREWAEDRGLDLSIVTASTVDDPATWDEVSRYGV